MMIGTAVANLASAVIGTAGTVSETRCHLVLPLVSDHVIRR